MSLEPSDPPTEINTIRCRVCCEEIRAGAQLCVKCKSPQDWTVHLFRWKEVLAAILALAPLYSAAISLRQLAVKGPLEPRISAVVLSCDTVRVAVAIANVGTAAGVVRTPELEVLRPGMVPERYMLDPDSNGSPESRVVKVGESLELKLLRRVSGAEAVPIEDSSAELMVQVPYLGFDGQSGLASDRCAPQRKA